MQPNSNHFFHSVPYLSQSRGLLAAILALAMSFTNIWVLPQKLGLHGGGAYVLIFALSLFFFGLPLLLAELVLGRLIGTSINGKLASGWLAALYTWFARLSVLVALTIASIFSMISGWGMAYLVRVLGGNIASSAEQDVSQEWQYISTNTEVSMLWLTLFILLVLMIVARPVQQGLERFTERIMMLLALILVALLFMAIRYGDASRALGQMLTIDFAAVDFNAVVSIFEHVFYSLGLGIGAVMMLGRYSISPVETPPVLTAPVGMPAVSDAPETVSESAPEPAPESASATPPRLQNPEPTPQFKLLPIARVASLVALVDLVVLLILGFCVLALVPVGANGVMSADFDLVFIDLPNALAQNPHGQLIGVLFYALLVLSGISSCVVLLEPLVGKLSKRFGFSRLRAARSAAFLVWLVALGSVFSFSWWRDAKISLNPQIGNKIYTLFADQTIYTMLSYLSFALLLPLLAMALMYYIGFIANKKQVFAQLPNMPLWLAKFWYFVVRNLVPLVMLLIFLQASGLWGFIALRFSP